MDRREVSNINMSLCPDRYRHTNPCNTISTLDTDAATDTNTDIGISEEAKANASLRSILLQQHWPIFLAFFFAYATVGIGLSIIGPTLIQIGRQINVSSMSELSLSYAARAVGFFLGSLSGGQILDRTGIFATECVLAITIAISGAMLSIFPHIKNLFQFLLASLGSAYTMGIIDNFVQILLIKICREEVGPFLQALHFGFAIGAVIAPTIASLFIENTSTSTRYKNAYYLLTALTISSAIYVGFLTLIDKSTSSAMKKRQDRDKEKLEKLERDMKVRKKQERQRMLKIQSKHDQNNKIEKLIEDELYQTNDHKHEKLKDNGLKQQQGHEEEKYSNDNLCAKTVDVTNNPSNYVILTPTLTDIDIDTDTNPTTNNTATHTPIDTTTIPETPTTPSASPRVSTISKITHHQIDEDDIIPFTEPSLFASMSAGLIGRRNILALSTIENIPLDDIKVDHDFYTHNISTENEDNGGGATGVEICPYYPNDCPFEVGESTMLRDYPELEAVSDLRDNKDVEKNENAGRSENNENNESNDSNEVAIINTNNEMDVGLTKDMPNEEGNSPKYKNNNTNKDNSGDDEDEDEDDEDEDEDENGDKVKSLLAIPSSSNHSNQPQTSVVTVPSSASLFYPTLSLSENVKIHNIPTHPRSLSYSHLHHHPHLYQHSQQPSGAHPHSHTHTHSGTHSEIDSNTHPRIRPHSLSFSSNLFAHTRDSHHFSSPHHSSSALQFNFNTPYSQIRSVSRDHLQSFSHPRTRSFSHSISNSISDSTPLSPHHYSISSAIFPQFQGSVALFVGLVSVMLFFYIGIETAIGSFLATYSYKMGLLAESQAAALTSAYWGFFALGRLIGIPLSLLFSESQLILADIIISCIALILLIIFSSHVIALWLCTCLLGFAVASLYAASISFLEKTIHITGKIMSVVVALVASSEAIFPFIIGLSFVLPTGPISMMYIGTGTIALCAIMFIIMSTYRNTHLITKEMMIERTTQGNEIKGKHPSKIELNLLLGFTNDLRKNLT